MNNWIPSAFEYREEKKTFLRCLAEKEIIEACCGRLYLV